MTDDPCSLDGDRRARDRPGRRAGLRDVQVVRQAGRAAARRAHRRQGSGSARSRSRQRHPRCGPPPSTSGGRRSGLELDPQRREPQPAVRAGRRQPHVQFVHGNGRSAWRRWGSSSDSSSSLPFYAIPLVAALLWPRSRSSGCCGGKQSGSRSSSTPCPRPSS